jgi:hypothetical protein
MSDYDKIIQSYRTSTFADTLTTARFESYFPNYSDQQKYANFKSQMIRNEEMTKSDITTSNFTSHYLTKMRSSKEYSTSILYTRSLCENSHHEFTRHTLNYTCQIPQEYFTNEKYNYVTPMSLNAYFHLQLSALLLHNDIMYGNPPSHNAVLWISQPTRREHHRLIMRSITPSTFFQYFTSLKTPADYSTLLNYAKPTGQDYDIHTTRDKLIPPTLFTHAHNILCQQHIESTPDELVQNFLQKKMLQTLEGTYTAQDFMTRSENITHINNAKIVCSKAGNSYKYCNDVPITDNILLMPIQHQPKYINDFEAASYMIQLMIKDTLQNKQQRQSIYKTKVPPTRFMYVKDILNQYDLLLNFTSHDYDKTREFIFECTSFIRKTTQYPIPLHVISDYKNEH